ncbi:MAG: hypothetical protein KYX66_12365 [Blastomonas fulva]|uniref:hypothetical protein n=1 Tax=Blastomonas fulva TaxID=1550728 RepID=UPI0024E25DED|nr:hypothetical protein [Blastomonas fulva]MDK2757519.1 hypothetical protein [Blastomonas fulva]
MNTQHTPSPWFVGAQNDAFYIVAGRAPAPNNDHPWHEAPRVVVAKVFGPSNHDVLPVNAPANAQLIAAAPAMLAMLEQIAEGEGPVLHHDLLDLIAKAKGGAA